MSLEYEALYTLQTRHNAGSALVAFCASFRLVHNANVPQFLLVFARATRLGRVRGPRLEMDW